MLLLLTGASGAGKSTVRELIADELAAGVECVELGHIVRIPAAPTLAWRQQATEAVVQRAVVLQAVGRHVLLAGDPVAAGEVIAAPSADQLDAIAVCLLDVSAEVQAARLAQRGDDPRRLADHQAFASWMRAHAENPNHMTHVLSANGWEAMRWGRLRTLDPCDGGWEMHVLDTSGRTIDEVAHDVLAWSRRALRGQAPQIRVAEPDRRSRQVPQAPLRACVAAQIARAAAITGPDEPKSPTHSEHVPSCQYTFEVACDPSACTPVEPGTPGTVNDTSFAPAWPCLAEARAAA